MKTGIICETYKVKMFQDALTEADISFVSSQSKEYPELSSIICECEQSDIKPIFDRVASYFTNLNTISHERAN